MPVVVKESYFPNWQVHGADGPYRLAPNLMVVIPREHDVSLTYGLTPVDWLGRILTLAGLAGLVALVRWKGARKYCAFPPGSRRGPIRAPTARRRRPTRVNPLVGTSLHHPDGPNRPRRYHDRASGPLVGETGVTGTCRSTQSSRLMTFAGSIPTN